VRKKIASPVSLACEKCTTGRMAATHLHRMGGCLWWLGGLMGIVGLLYCIAALAMFAGPGDAGVTGGILLFGFAVLFVGVVIFHLGKRKVWKCHNCGYFFDRAAP